MLAEPPSEASNVAHGRQTLETPALKTTRGREKESEKEREREGARGRKRNGKTNCRKTSKKSTAYLNFNSKVSISRSSSQDSRFTRSFGRLGNNTHRLSEGK